MKRTTKTTKLALDREPIRPLTNVAFEDLAKIAGGAPPPTTTKTSCGCTTY